MVYEAAASKKHYAFRGLAISIRSIGLQVRLSIYTQAKTWPQDVANSVCFASKEHLLRGLIAFAFPQESMCFAYANVSVTILQNLHLLLSSELFSGNIFREFFKQNLIHSKTLSILNIRRLLWEKRDR